MAERRYIGCVHLHSAFSDGAESVESIVAAAREAGLDFVVISDHDSDACREAGLVGWHDGVLCMSAPEIGGWKRPHFLHFVPGPIDDVDSSRPLEALETTAERGGLNFIAHPHPAELSIWPSRPVGWTQWQTDAYCGMELWSYMHDVCHLMRPWQVFTFARRHTRMISGPRPETLEQWDRLCQDRRVAAIAGLDNHARRFALVGTFLPHAELFRTQRNHVQCEELPEDGLAAELTLSRAMAEGRTLLALDLWADAREFSFTVSRSGDAPPVGMGQEVRFAPGMVLHVRSPEPAELTIVRDGCTVERRTGTTLIDRPVDAPGVYRVEARHRGRPWVWTNPIYIRPSGETGKGA